jgi:hypothetical protein
MDVIKECRKGRNPKGRARVRSPHNKSEQAQFSTVLYSPVTTEESNISYIPSAQVAAK